MESVVRIYNDLTDRPTLREMCTNPLVLSHVCRAGSKRRFTKSRQNSRTEFYSNGRRRALN